MADARLNLNHKPFEIEVNGKGETITVDVMSLDFPLRFQKAYESILKIENKAKAEELIISKKQDHKSDHDILSSNEKERIKMMNDRFNEMRAVIDDLFGEGASKKIFGDYNWVTMFHEFFDAITPVLKEAGMKADSVYESIEKKYGKVDDQEL